MVSETKGFLVWRHFSVLCSFSFLLSKAGLCCAPLNAFACTCGCRYVYVLLCKPLAQLKEGVDRSGEKRVLLAEHPHSIKLKYLLFSFPGQ